ncbi:MAG TPA: thioredoxin fold domain-containing protein [Dissulfurispiraceae bacterium]|nr:thioredoxin fold domain-containing protein [Dissulfurispiraceae bacterium]
MFKNFTIAVLAAGLLIGTHAEAAGLCDGVTKEFLNAKVPFTVEEILDKKEISDLKFCQVLIRVQSQKGSAYVTADKEAVLVGDLFRNKKRVSEQAFSTIDEGSFRKHEKEVNQAVAFSYKPAGAHKHIYMFTDPDCPYCEKVKAEVQQWAFEKKIEVRVILFPLPMHPTAREKAVKGICASMTYDNYVRAEYPGQSCKAGEDKITASITVAKKIGVDGTPIFVGPTGKRSVGFSKESVEKILR